MPKFEIGDRVTLLNDSREWRDLKAGTVGTVQEESCIPFVLWDGLYWGRSGVNGSFAVDEIELKLLDQPTAKQYTSIDDLKSGDTVVIKSSVSDIVDIDRMDWIPVMEEYLGKTFTVYMTEPSRHGARVRLYSNSYVWYNEMIDWDATTKVNNNLNYTPKLIVKSKKQLEIENIESEIKKLQEKISKKRDLIEDLKSRD